MILRHDTTNHTIKFPIVKQNCSFYGSLTGSFQRFFDRAAAVVNNRIFTRFAVFDLFSWIFQTFESLFKNIDDSLVNSTLK